MVDLEGVLEVAAINHRAMPGRTAEGGGPDTI